MGRIQVRHPAVVLFAAAACILTGCSIADKPDPIPPRIMVNDGESGVMDKDVRLTLVLGTATHYRVWNDLTDPPDTLALAEVPEGEVVLEQDWTLPSDSIPDRKRVLLEVVGGDGLRERADAEVSTRPTALFFFETREGGWIQSSLSCGVRDIQLSKTWRLLLTRGTPEPVIDSAATVSTDSLRFQRDLPEDDFQVEWILSNDFQTLHERRSIRVDVTPPGAVPSLTVVSESKKRIAASWTPASDARSGVARYEIKYALEALTDGEWDDYENLGDGVVEGGEGEAADTLAIAGPVDSAGTYFVGVVALDSAGNKGALLSSSVTVASE
jgi:hypothetical protein